MGEIMAPTRQRMDPRRRRQWRRFVKPEPATNRVSGDKVKKKERNEPDAKAAKEILQRAILHIFSKFSSPIRRFDRS